MNIDDILSRFSGRVYVPDAILKEISDDHTLVRRLSRYGGIKHIDPNEEPNRYQALKKLSQERLEQTRKNKDYLVLKRIIGEGVVPKGVTDRDLARYEEMEEEIEGRLRVKRIEPTKTNKLHVLERNYRVSEGDIEVLTTALYKAAHKKQTRIIAYDTHLRDATKSLIEEFPTLGKYLKYVDYREYQKAA